MSAASVTSPPPTIGARCAFAAHLGAVVLAVAFLALSCGDNRPLLLLHAALAASVALLLRQRLAGTGQLQACLDEDDSPTAGIFGATAATSPALASLRRRAAALESLRGTARFDPWESLELRRQLAAATESD